jgi:hypothetical protein
MSRKESSPEILQMCGAQKLLYPRLRMRELNMLRDRGVMNRFDRA